jgi:hypothetical protein
LDPNPNEIWTLPFVCFSLPCRDSISQVTTQTNDQIDTSRPHRECNLKINHINFWYNLKVVVRCNVGSPNALSPKYAYSLNYGYSPNDFSPNDPNFVRTLI